LVDHWIRITYVGNLAKIIARTIGLSSLFVPKGHPPTPRGAWGNFGETRGVLIKSGVLECKSGNMSERVKIDEKLL